MTGEDTEFLNKFEARARQYADRVANGDLPPSYAAMELLAAMFSAKELPTKQLLASFPVDAWKEDTITVPTALLRPIVEGWTEYREHAGQLPLEKALGISAQRKGGSSTAREETTNDRNRSLSNAAVLDYVASILEGKPVSQQAVFAGVAEKQGCSEEAVRSAYKKFGKGTIEAMVKAGFISPNWKEGPG